MINIPILSTAATRAIEAMVQLHERNWFVYPTKERVAWRGFSYNIPKEEQFRSLLYSALSAGSTDLWELEWRTYRYNEEKGRLEAGSEIDLVGFARNCELSALLEVKRGWSLYDWTEKPSETRSGIEGDVSRLRELLKRLPRRAKARPSLGIGPGLLAGVVVLLMSNSEAGLGDLASQVLVSKAARLTVPSRLGTYHCSRRHRRNFVYDKREGDSIGLHDLWAQAWFLPVRASR